jgi:hypothetical protein
LIVNTPIGQLSFESDLIGTLFRLKLGGLAAVHLITARSLGLKALNGFLPLRQAGFGFKLADQRFNLVIIRALELTFVKTAA